MTDTTIDQPGDAAWPSQAHASRIRMRPLTALLAVALVAVAGIYGGAELQKRNGTSSGTAASSFAGGTAGNRAGGFTGGPGGTTSAAGGATRGTVTQVTAKTLYLTSSTGKLVKVVLTARTTFTRTATSAKSGLTLGDTAIVQGTKNAAGTLVATSVIATAKGVTSTFGGGAGGFGGAPAG
jgi:hypothetical protein